MTITVGPNGLILPDGKNLPLISGSVQYWRLERELWPAILDSVVELGFHLIETYVPWGVHEVSPGMYDFGQIVPARDLGAFLRLCAERDIYVLLRPGPNQIAELTWYGFPERILFDPEIQARTRAGTPALYDFFIKPAPAPSYACEKLYDEFAPYLDAVFEVVRPYLNPHGPVIGFQVDNELSYFFRLAMFDLDYAPAAVALYRRYLAERYGDIAELNQAYGTHHSSYAEVDPPTAFHATSLAELPYYLDWARFKEYYLLYPIQRLAAMLHERGDGFITTHNYPGLVGPFPTVPYSSPYQLHAAEQTIDVCGIDSYPTKEMYASLKSQVLQVAAASRLPYIAEFGSGVWSWIRPLLPDDEEFSTLTALMHGTKGINFYMLVERDRWTGSPIMRDNRLRPGYADLFRRFNAFLSRTGALTYERQAPVLLLANRDYERLAGVSALFTPPSRQYLFFMQPEIYLNEECLGFRRPIALEHHHWWRDWQGLLNASHCEYDASDTELPLARLSRYSLVVTPSFDFLSREVQAKLISYVEGGGRLVVGPDLPYLDENMQPYSLLADQLRDVGQGSLAANVHLLPDLPSLDSWRDLLAGWDLKPLMSPDCDAVDVVVHRRGNDRLVYVANPTAQSHAVDLSVSLGPVLRDLWTDEILPAAAISLPPYCVRVLETENQ
jgi:beta-galactosidase